MKCKSLRAAFLHAQLNATERDSLVRNFQAGKLDVLVTTAQVGGTGITLTKAMRVVALEAGSDSSLHEQCLARAHRFGNLNWLGMTVLELFNNDSPTEMLVKGRREKRLRLTQTSEAAALAQMLKAREMEENSDSDGRASR